VVESYDLYNDSIGMCIPFVSNIIFGIFYIPDKFRRVAEYPQKLGYYKTNTTISNSERYVHHTSIANINRNGDC
jgi:hypothetical protein